MSDNSNAFNKAIKLHQTGKLEEAIKNNYKDYVAEDGFFWGQQFQEESMKEYKEQDLQFCEEALKWLEEGKQVYYECWY